MNLAGPERHEQVAHVFLSTEKDSRIVHRIKVVPAYMFGFTADEIGTHPEYD